MSRGDYLRKVADEIELMEQESRRSGEADAARRRAYHERRAQVAAMTRAQKRKRWAQMAKARRHSRAAAAGRTPGLAGKPPRRVIWGGREYPDAKTLAAEWGVHHNGVYDAIARGWAKGRTIHYAGQTPIPESMVGRSGTPISWNGTTFPSKRKFCNWLAARIEAGCEPIAGHFVTEQGRASA